MDRKIPCEKNYAQTREEEVVIDSPNGGIDGFVDNIPAEELKKAFYVPKICNHCDNRSMRPGLSCRGNI